MKKHIDMAPADETSAQDYGFEPEMKELSPTSRLKKRSKRGMKRRGRRKAMR